MLKHLVQINVSSGKNSSLVLKGGELSLRNRMLTSLLGKKQRLLVLVPADCVQSVSIKEVEDEVISSG